MSHANKAPGWHRGHTVKHLRALYGTAKATPKGWQSPHLPRDWRQRLPEPEGYYRAKVPTLGKRKANGWAQGRCPFHEDGRASLSVSMVHGGWRCFAGCGQGDLLAFHMRLSGKPFADAVRDLLGVPA